MMIGNLALGGAEWAFVRQANALASANHQVTCYVPYYCDSSSALFAALDQRIQIVTFRWMTDFLHRVLYKLTLVFPRINLEQRLHSAFLKRLNRRNRFDVVNPHLHIATVVACQAFMNDPVPIIETDHGDYALLLQDDPPFRRLSIPLQRVDALICPSSTNQNRIAHLPWSSRFRSSVIPYSYESPSAHIDRALPQDDIFTFGMVSRGVPEKGWEEAIEAFRAVRLSSTRPMRLILVGGSSYLQALERDLEPDLKTDVIFVGSQPDIRPWIECFDVGLLPSYFAAESLPNVIIECLAQGKPVIATDIGGIPDMLDTVGQTCGILVPLNASSNRADLAQLTASMQRLLDDSSLLKLLAQNAIVKVRRYRPEVVVNALVSFFDSVRVSMQHSSKATLAPSPTLL